MKKAGRSLATVLLLLTLTTAAFGGQMDTPPAPTTGGGQMDTPPAPSTGGEQINTTSTIYVSESALTDTLADYALDIWIFLPSLF